ncbi:MAG: hypothetical protein ACM3NH_02630 [Candidatus Saccharibacteria bacterium]
MYRRAEQIFYASAIAILMAALFVIHPGRSMAVADLQDRMFSDAGLAVVQLIGDEPLFEGVSDLWAGVTGFYGEAADSMLALLAPTESEYRLASSVREGVGSMREFALAYRTASGSSGISNDLPETIASNIEPIGEPLYNIVPDKNAGSIAWDMPKKSPEPKVAGVAIVKPVPAGQSWVTIEDAITRQKDCLAVYNGEVNIYLGECHYEFN